MVTNNIEEALLLANRIYIFSTLPTTISNEIIVDIPIEERNTEIVNNKRYNELRVEINTIMRKPQE
jgi:NitT/TauT family transport system ATP-binding protein